MDNTAPQTRADSARVESGCEALDPDATKTAFDELDAVLHGLAQQVVHTLDQMIPRLAEMQALLSQRGKARKKVLKTAGVPSWSDYATAYAQKLDCSMRTIQDHITGFRRTGKSGSSLQNRSTPQSKPLRLDAREQATLVKAQLAANEMVAAWKNGGDWQAAMAEYDRVAVAPNKLDSFVNTLIPQANWKTTLIELLDVLEQHGDRLPLAVLNKKRVIEKLLEGNDLPSLGREGHAQSAKRYHKVKKLDAEGIPCWTLKAESEKTEWGTFEIESEADEATEHLNSPAASLSDFGAESKKLPGSVTLDWAGYNSMHEGVA